MSRTHGKSFSIEFTWPVVIRRVSAPCGQTLIGGRRRAQSGDHFHHIRQDHVTWADCSAAFQDRTIGLLLYVQVWFDGHRSPATHWVYGDLLIVGTEGKEEIDGLMDIKYMLS